jgi:hypothetical protein
VRGLLYYVFTEGLAGEEGLESAHTQPRVIAGWDGADALVALQPPVCADGQRDFGALVSPAPPNRSSPSSWTGPSSSGSSPSTT